MTAVRAAVLFFWPDRARTPKLDRISPLWHFMPQSAVVLFWKASLLQDIQSASFMALVIYPLTACVSTQISASRSHVVDNFPWQATGNCSTNRGIVSTIRGQLDQVPCFFCNYPSSFSPQGLQPHCATVPDNGDPIEFGRLT